MSADQAIETEGTRPSQTVATTDFFTNNRAPTLRENARGPNQQYWPGQQAAAS